LSTKILLIKNTFSYNKKYRGRYFGSGPGAAPGVDPVLNGRVIISEKSVLPETRIVPENTAYFSKYGLTRITRILYGFFFSGKIHGFYTDLFSEIRIIFKIAFFLDVDM
jgi:hypothetical protein